jgi:nitrogenase-associated protein
MAPNLLCYASAWALSLNVADNFVTKGKSMAKIKFYRKMDCVNNGKQLKILQDAGNEVETIDLLEHPLTRAELESFFGSKPAADFINRNAPAVKRGEIKPDSLEREEAFKLLLESHLLIKRPLIEVDGLKIVGFTDPRLKPYLGAWKGEEDVVTCKNSDKLGVKCGK